MGGQLEGKVALVTGAARGIGRSCAERLASEGATVVITDLLDSEGSALAEALHAQGLKAAYRRHDVATEQSWIEVVAAIRAEHGQLDVLVNNAGVAIAGSILEMPAASFRRQVSVNLEGVFFGVKHAIPLMRVSGDGGSIVNMSSVAGLKGKAGLAGYCATKGGVRLLTKAVALECAAAGDGIRVNSLHPGIIETAIWDDILGADNLPGENGRIRAQVLDGMSRAEVPLARRGRPEEIANGVLWLASDQSRYVTGTEFVIDGGMSIA